MECHTLAVQFLRGKISGVDTFGPYAVKDTRLVPYISAGNYIPSKTLNRGKLQFTVLTGLTFARP
jgi:hypothetical protein